LLVNYADVAHLKAAQPVPPVLDATNNIPLADTNRVVKPPIKPRLPEILSRQFVDRLEKELQLTLDQRADIEKIIAQSQDEARKSFQSIRQEARQSIREELTDEQKKRFDDLFKLNRGGKKPSNGTNAPVSMPPAEPATNSNSAV
jgi:Spy/CpxP family protein refolding chaperone